LQQKGRRFDHFVSACELGSVRVGQAATRLAERVGYCAFEFGALVRPSLSVFPDVRTLSVLAQRPELPQTVRLARA
jgi:hypothetical protein